MESSSVEKDLGIVVGSMQNTSEHCAPTGKASCILDFISKPIASRSTEGVTEPKLEQKTV